MDRTTALVMFPQSQPFRAGLKFGPGPPGLQNAESGTDIFPFLS